MIVKKNPNIDTNMSECIEASVKWYNPAKGYGFLLRDTDSTDIMIHFSVLDAIGCPYIKEGDRVVCYVGLGKRGLQVEGVKEVKFGSTEPRTLSAFFKTQSRSFEPENLEEIEGVVKWFNSKKGYGFIYPKDGKGEIFLHASVLHAAGHKSLLPGVRILAKVSTSERGQEAQELTILDDDNEKQQAV